MGRKSKVSYEVKLKAVLAYKDGIEVAKSAIATMYNQNEVKLWNFLGEKSSIIKINHIFEVDENGYWYVAEKIKMSG